MIEWLHDGEVGQSPLRDELLADFAAVGGYPRAAAQAGRLVRSRRRRRRLRQAGTRDDDVGAASRSCR